MSMHLKQDQILQTINIQDSSHVHQLIIKISSAWSFLVPEILQIDEDKLQSFIETNDNLKRYEFDLKLINEKRPHILDAEQEITY